MVSRLAPLPFVLLLIALAALPALAEGEQEDVVVLKNGSVWKGRIVKEDENSVLLEQGSDTGGLAQITFKREDIDVVRRGEGGPAPGGGARPIRTEWFLLRSGGRIVGTRHLELWSVRTSGQPGFRLEEHVEFFSQGPHLPATRTDRVEVVDLRFFPILLTFREIGDASEMDGGPERYERSVSGRVRDGVWHAASFNSGNARSRQVPVPEGTRGRLGFREHLLRLPRHVRLLDSRVVDPESEGLVAVRAGFASIPPAGGPPGAVHEFHWEEGNRRLISAFGADTTPIREEIAEGMMALPVSRQQAQAAQRKAVERPAGKASQEITLPEAGIAFALPDPLWSWTPALGSPANTGWRLLGRLDTRIYLADVRLEWHPQTAPTETDPGRVEAWLLQRLRGACPDLEVTARREPVSGLTGAWRLGLAGTLNREKVRSIAVVVDRPRGRVVLLLACPAGAWEQGRPAFDRFLSSLRLL